MPPVAITGIAASHAPTTDTGSGADGAALYQQFEALQKELASAHKAQAEKWQKADRSDQALLHWKMVQRWNKDDKDAQGAIAFYVKHGFEQVCSAPFLLGTDLQFDPVMVRPVSLADATSRSRAGVAVTSPVRSP